MDLGFYDYEHRDLEAASVTCRKHGIKPAKLEDLRAENATWDELHATRKKVIQASKGLIQTIEAVEDEAEASRIGKAHDINMAALDLIDGEMTRRKSFGQTTPVTLEQRGVPGSSGSCSAVAGLDDAERRSGWVDQRGQEVRVYAPSEPLLEGRASGYSVGDIGRMMLFGPRDDNERRALSEGTDSAGGYTVPTRLASEFIDKLRANTVCFEAGARLVPMDSDNLAIARVTGDPTVTWTAENAEITASDPTFDAVTLAPKKLATLVKVSRELLEDSVNIAAVLEAAIFGRMGEELDRALLFGSGASNEPTGLFNISGINSVSMGDNGAALANYDPLIDSMYEIALDKGAKPSAFIMHPRTEAALAKLKDSQNNPLTEPSMTAAVRKLATTAVPIDQDQGTATDQCSTVLSGDFSKMLVGMRRRIELRLLDQRYAEYDQVGFIATLRADVAVENPVHFCKLIGIKAA